MADRYTNLINLEPGDIARDQEDELDYIVDKIVPLAEGGVLVFALGIYNNMLKTWSGLTTPEIPATVVKKNIKLQSTEEVWRSFEQTKGAARVVAKRAGVEDDFIKKLSSDEPSSKFLRDFLLISNTATNSASTASQSEAVQASIFKALSSFNPGVYYSEAQIYEAFETMADEGVDKDLLKQFSQQLANRFRSNNYTEIGESQDLVDLLTSKSGGYDKSLLALIDKELLSTNAFTTGVDVRYLDPDQKGALSFANRLMSGGDSAVLGDYGANFAPYTITTDVEETAAARFIGGAMATQAGVKPDRDSGIYKSIARLLRMGVVREETPDGTKPLEKGRAFYTVDENAIGIGGRFEQNRGGFLKALITAATQPAVYGEASEEITNKFEKDAPLNVKYDFLKKGVGRGKHKVWRDSQKGPSLPLAKAVISRTNLLEEMKASSDEKVISFETRSFIQGLKLSEGQKVTHQEIRELEAALGVKQIVLKTEELATLEKMEVGAGIVTGKLSLETFKQILGGDLTDERAREILRSREGLVQRLAGDAAVKIVRAKNKAELVAGNIDVQRLSEALTADEDSEVFRSVERKIAGLTNNKLGNSFQVYAQVKAKNGVGTAGARIQEMAFDSLAALRGSLQSNDLDLVAMGLIEKGKLTDAKTQAAILLTAHGTSQLSPESLTRLVSDAKGAGDWRRGISEGVDEIRAAFINKAGGGVVSAAIKLPESFIDSDNVRINQKILLEQEINKVNQALEYMSPTGRSGLIGAMDIETERIAEGWKITEISFMTSNQASMLEDLIRKAGLEDEVRNASLEGTKNDKREALSRVLKSKTIAQIQGNDFRDIASEFGIDEFNPNVQTIESLYQSTFILKHGEESSEETLKRTIDTLARAGNNEGKVFSHNRAEPEFLIKEVRRVVKDTATQEKMISQIHKLDRTVFVDSAIPFQAAIPGSSSASFSQGAASHKYLGRGEFHLAGMDIIDNFRILKSAVPSDFRVELADQTQKLNLPTEGLEYTIDLSTQRTHFGIDGETFHTITVDNKVVTLSTGRFLSFLGNSTQQGIPGQKEALDQSINDRVRRKFAAMNPAGMYTRYPADARELRQIDAAQMETLTERILGSTIKIGAEDISLARYVSRKLDYSVVDDSLGEKIQDILTTPTTIWRGGLLDDELGIKPTDDATNLLDWWIRNAFTHLNTEGGLTADTIIADTDKAGLRSYSTEGLLKILGNGESDLKATELFSEILGKSNVGERSVDNILWSLNSGAGGRDQYRAFFLAMALSGDEIEMESGPQVSFTMFSKVSDNGKVIGIDKWTGPLSGRHTLSATSNDTNVASNTILRSLSNVLRSAGEIVKNDDGTVNVDKSSPQSVASWNFVAEALGKDNANSDQVAELFERVGKFEAKDNLVELSPEQKGLIGDVVAGLSQRQVEFADGTSLSMLDISLGNGLSESLGGDILTGKTEAVALRGALSSAIGRAASEGKAGEDVFDRVFATANAEVAQHIIDRSRALDTPGSDPGAAYREAIKFSYKTKDLQKSLQENDKLATVYNEIIRTPGVGPWMEEFIREKGKAPTMEEFRAFQTDTEAYELLDKSDLLKEPKRVKAETVGDTNPNQVVQGISNSVDDAATADQHELLMKVPKRTTDSYAARKLHEKAMEESGGKLMMAGMALGMLMSEPDIQQDLNNHTVSTPYGKINNEGINLSGGRGNTSFNTATHSKLYLDAYGETSNSQDTTAALSEITTMSSSYGPIRTSTVYPYKKKLESMQAYDYLSNI